MNKKKNSIFSKFKFKWWSWELDSVKILPALLIMFAFLPVLPYEKKDGKLMSVFGIEASVNNFYEIGWRKASAIEAEGGYEILKGEAFYGLAKHLETPIPNTIKHKEYLIKKGIPIEKANCIILRDFLLYSYYWDNEMRILLNTYPPSPVPIIWLARIPVKYLLELIATTSTRFEDFNKLVKKCSKFKNMSPPVGYLEGDFSYKRK